MSNLLDSISIVLVEPQSPGNVGMVCRAMKNMGLTDLRLVNPCDLQHPEAGKFAVSARDLLNSARHYTALDAAISDCALTVATTRRHGKYRQEIQTPRQIVQRFVTGLSGNRAALVFGREDSGLTTDEVAMCRWQATIPTHGDYGSLNLAQAVLVFCYELCAGLSGTGEVADRQMADSEEQEALFRHMEMTLSSIGFLNPQNPDHLMRSLRRIFARADLDSREVAILRGMMSQVDWAADNFTGKKKRI